MNRIFLSGRTKKTPQVFYTPRGERIISFPLLVDDGHFLIEVVFKDPPDSGDIERKEGSSVMAFGELMKSPEKSKAAFRVKAHNIVWMEE